MQGIGALDPSLLIALGLALTMGACLVVLFTMRDRTWTPPRLYTRTLQCQEIGRPARVRIMEQRQNGLPVRSVQRCSLWVYGRRQCQEQCLQSVAAA
jgi:hypothetical protein